MLIPLALASTAIVCMSSVLRFIFVDSFRKAFSDDLDMKWIANVLRVFILIGYTLKHLFLSPFYLLVQVLASPVLVFAWIKSDIVGFARLADFVCSTRKVKVILASNRFDEIGKPKVEEDKSKISPGNVKRYDGVDVETELKAILGYAFGIYDFDVKRSSCGVLSEPNELKPAPKIEAQCFGFEGYRLPGRKWM